MRVSEITYANWKQGEPNYLYNDQVESCIHLWSWYSHAWNDAPCGTESCFVCEIDF